ncbi:MAG: DUF2911 domain-containing protein [Opitutaceae bacterium]|jgi:hypothetical protein
MNRYGLPIISALVLATGLFAQDPKVQLPQQSPLCTIKQSVGVTDIGIAYSRPGVKGREIFGKMIPFGAVWRTGANSSTKLSFSTPVKLNGTEIPAGSYALYTIPGESEWTIIVYKDTSLWGAYGYDQKNDFARIKATPVKLAEPVETFTIDINDIRTESATLNLIWEKTKVPVRLEFDTISKTVAQLEETMAAQGEKTAGFYYQALDFCLSNNTALPKALAWANQAAVQFPKVFWVIQKKAYIQAKLGDKTGALETAKIAAAAAKASGSDQKDFLKVNDEFVASLR